MKHIIILILAGIFLLQNITYASNKDAGTTVGQFLKIGAGARATGMGGAYTALANDTACLYWNPAGLGLVDRREFSWTYLSYIQGMQYGYLGLIESTKFGVCGASLNYLLQDDLEGFDNNANEIGNFSAKDIAISLSCGQKINKRLLVGETLRFINMRIETEKARGVSLDLGALYKPDISGLRLSAVAKNISLGGMKFIHKKEKLPFTLQVGSAYQLPCKEITLSTDLTMRNDNKGYLSFGTEYWLQDTIAVRLGYKTGPMDEGSKFAVGFGYKFGLFTVDYASESFNKIGKAHHLSCQYRF